MHTYKGNAWNHVYLFPFLCLIYFKRFKSSPKTTELSSHKTSIYQLYAVLLLNFLVKLTCNDDM